MRVRSLYREGVAWRKVVSGAGLAAPAAQRPTFMKGTPFMATAGTRARQVALVASVLAVGAAHGELVRINANEVLDTEARLVWLFDWTQGAGDWRSAYQWAQALDVGGRDNWRLPTLNHYETLWANAGASTDDLAALFLITEIPDLGFEHVGHYWARDHFISPPTNALRAGLFNPQTGATFDDYVTWVASATAVRSAVPEPGSLFLAVAALGAAPLALRRRADEARRRSAGTAA